MSDTQTLSLVLRPKSFDRVIGQDSVISSIRNQIASGRIPASWMFRGPSGYGKTTMGRILGRALCCYDLKHYETLKVDPSASFGAACVMCNGQQYSLNEINAGSVKGIEEIGQLAESSIYQPPPNSPRRIYILDEAQNISAQAQDLLLKYFEDAPLTTNWIICTTDPGKIKATLRKRCFEYSLNPLDSEGTKLLIRRAAKHANFTGDVTKLQETLERFTITAPRDILTAAEKFFSGMPPNKAIIGQDTGVDTLKVSRHLLDGNWPGVQLQLRKAASEEITAVRAAILGYMRGVILKADDQDATAKRAAKIILTLTRDVPYETGFQIYWLAAVLYSLCN